MTRRRKILVGVVMVLMCANIVALLRAEPEPVEALWFGMNFEADLLDFTDGRPANYPEDTVQLHRDGASKNGRRVPYIAMIDNMGRAEYLEMKEVCYYGCRSNPWIAMAFTDNDTPMAVVIAAYHAVRAACKSDVIIGTMFPPHFTSFAGDKALGGQFPLMIAKSDDPAIASFGAIHPFNATLEVPSAETLDRFAEESGCGRVSPLRP